MDRRYLVLIIEDNDDFQSLYGMTAEMAGYEVEQIYDGEEAIKRLDREPIPTIVLLDARLPMVNGFEILQAARSKEKWAKVPIYLLTADIRATQPLKTGKYHLSHANGIIEKGGESIHKLRELFAKFKQETGNQ